MSVVNPQSSPSGPFDYDVIVIGGGPGGYVAAIRAAQLGARVAVVESGPLGGTCLNVGCIPTKAVISSVALYHNMQNARAFGLVAEKVGYDIGQIVNGARGVVKQLVSGVGVLLKKNNIALLAGRGSLADAHTVVVTNGTESKRVAAGHIIIATGSRPARPRIEGLDAFPAVWTSDDAVFADHVPERLLVVGGGAVGLEFAYIFNSLGAKVTLVEMMPSILPACDRDASGELAKQLGKQGIDIRTDTKLTKASGHGKSGKVSLTSGDKTGELETNVILLAAGRIPVTDGLNLDAAGVKMEGPRIVVDQYYQTSAPSVYAIGDVIGEPLLAHAASAEGEAAAANILGHKETVNYHAMPAAVYTHPEVAVVGYSEEQAREKYSDVVVGKFPFAINGRAMGERESAGFVKLVVSAKYGEILGAHLVGPHASDLLAECVTAIASEITIDELIASVHAHPTLSEVVMEAAHDVRGRCIHKV